MDVEFLRYQFEDGYYGVVTKSGFRIGVRHLQMLYMVASAVVMGVVRGSMGVTVLAVADPTRHNDTYIKVHHWDSRVQGAVLSSFFFGYAVMLVPAELYLRRMGGRLLMTAVLIVNGALCVAMPTIINRSGWVAACNAKLFMGMAHACFNSINQSLLQCWLPPNEKKIFGPLVYGSIQIGIIIALPVSGQLAAAPLGWELVYYSLAMLTLSMAVISGTLTASSPDGHQAIGDDEKQLIEETLKCYRKKVLKKPIRKILKSSRFWAAVFAHASTNVLYIFYLSKVPAYLLAFGISLKNSAWYTMLPFILLSATYYGMGPIINWINGIRFLNNIYISTFFRKFVNTCGAFGVIIGLVVLSNFHLEWINLVVIILTAILGLVGLQFCGFLSNYGDMSENFSGTLMMISSAVSSLAGTAVPIVSGLILGEHSTDSRRWSIVLLAIVSFYIMCNIVYTFFGSNERQAWDQIGISKNEGKQLGRYNGVLDGNQVQLDELCLSKLHQDNQDEHEIDTVL